MREKPTTRGCCATSRSAIFSGPIANINHQDGVSPSLKHGRQIPHPEIALILIADQGYLSSLAGLHRRVERRRTQYAGKNVYSPYSCAPRMVFATFLAPSAMLWCTFAIVSRAMARTSVRSSPSISCRTNGMSIQSASICGLNTNLLGKSDCLPQRAALLCISFRRERKLVEAQPISPSGPDSKRTGRRK